MEFRRKNIIQKQVIELEINASVDGFKIQGELEALCRDDLKRALDNLCERYSFTNEVIYLDSVFAHVEFASIDELQTAFSEKIIKELEKALSMKISDAATLSERTDDSLAKKALKVLHFYLKEGFLPWWSSINTLQEWGEFVGVLCSEAVARADWSPIFIVLKEKQARQRMRKIFTLQQTCKLIPGITGFSTESFACDLDTLLTVIVVSERRQKLREQYHDTLWLAIAEVNGVPSFGDRFADLLFKEIGRTYSDLFQMIDPGKIETAELKERLIQQQGSEENIYPDTLNMSEVYSESQKHKNEFLDQELEIPTNIQTGEVIYISNSGLVLVAAFLPMFFKDLHLLKDESLDSDKAIAVLQFMVSGLNVYEEFEIVLPKILCGLELGQSIKKTNISNKEKAKANDLLESVIEHWTVLKNTSVEGIRVSFLQREGRLVFQDNEWRLKIKQEAYDMLLSHLPWNIGMIKLPWMKCLLNVEWA